jgi:hypothetical protein
VEREGVWANNPDLVAFRQLVEELAARGPSLAPPAFARAGSGHRFGARLTGAAYYRDLELWAQSPRPDTVALRGLLEELRQRPPKEFVARLRARLAEVAALSITERRQAIGVSNEFVEVARAGGKVPAPIAARLTAFVAGNDPL